MAVLKDIDNLDIPRNVSKPIINELDCGGHLHLLEQFVSARDRVNKWAERHSLQAEAAWAIYINNAIPRLAKWFQYVSWGSIETAVPPLDMLLVWHAFLQDPVQYEEFTDVAGLRSEKMWDWAAFVSNLLCLSQLSDTERS